MLQSSCIFTLFNTIVFGLGCAIIGVGVWAVRHSDDLKEAVRSSDLRVIMAAGAFFILVSLIGLYGVCHKDRSELFELER